MLRHPQTSPTIRRIVRSSSTHGAAPATHSTVTYKSAYRRLLARGGLVAATICATALLVAAPADAHGLVGKQDLPLPKWLFGWAASAVLVISFVALALLWPKPRLQQAKERVVARLPRIVEPVCGLAGILGFAALVYAGLAGRQSAAVNILPTAVYIAFWVGVPFLTLIFGDVFRAFNPWRAAGRGFGWLIWRVAPNARSVQYAYPERLGYWPAAVGILGFATLELVVTDREEPRLLAILALCYASIQLTGMAVYGSRRWCERADAFGVYFSLFSTLSPVRLSSRAVRRRAVLSGTSNVRPAAGLVGLVSVMIGSTSFDGLTQSSLWTSAVADAQGWLVDRGFSASGATELCSLAGLLAMMGVVAGLYLLGCRGIRSAVRSSSGESTASVAARFAPTLIPIALAYVVAHYFGLLSYQGQALAYLVSDPLGDGGDLFGTARRTIDYGWISSTGIWYVQVIALVAGHAAGLVLAHDRALALYPGRLAVRSQYWMLAVMVSFTSLALWLLSNTE